MNNIPESVAGIISLTKAELLAKAKEMNGHHFVYVLYKGDTPIYCGATSNTQRRFCGHKINDYDRAVLYEAITRKDASDLEVFFTAALQPANSNIQYAGRLSQEPQHTKVNIEAGFYTEHSDAWIDFFSWVRHPVRWAAIPRPERDILFKANRAAMEGLPKPLGIRRMTRLFNQYAPGRYSVESRVVVIVHEDPQ
jgi:hypothetical protein